MSKMTTTPTLTLEELGRMQGASPEEVYKAREHFREGLEALGIPVNPRDYDTFVSVLEVPFYFEGEGKETHLVIGDRANGVVVNDFFNQTFKNLFFLRDLLNHLLILYGKQRQSCTIQKGIEKNP